MRVDAEYIEALKDEIRRINKQPLSKLQFYRKGKRCVLTGEALRQWRWYLRNMANNTDFFQYYDNLKKHNGKKPVTR